MLTDFPKPYPDELFYSIVLRYHKSLGGLNYFDALNDLFGGKSKLSLTSIGAIDYLCSQLPRLTKEYFIINHLFIPTIFLLSRKISS